MLLFQHRVYSRLLLLKRVTIMKRKVVEGGGTSRRLTLKALVLAPLAALVKPNKALADPNATRPTMLLNLQVVSTGQNTMRISGRYVTFEGYGIAGMEVKIYAIGAAYFSVGIMPTRVTTAPSSGMDEKYQGDLQYRLRFKETALTLAPIRRSTTHRSRGNSKTLLGFPYSGSGGRFAFAT